MPRVKPFRKDLMVEYQHEKLTKYCEALLVTKNVSKKRVAEMVGCTSQAVSNQFSKGKITLPVLIAVMSLTDADANEIGERMKFI